MGNYNRTIWKDHIKDQNGNVIQQGTPVSAKNLNNIENQVVTLSAKENALAELVRESIPSGFTTLSDLDYTYMSTNPNSIKLLNDSVAYVNGYKIVIPSSTVINLDVPPTSGSRDDLVFLEAWIQADVNGAEQLSWRLRVVSGVDFTTFPEGFMYWGPAWNSCLPTAQGANSSSLPYSSGSIQIFTKAYNWGGINSQGRGAFNMSSDAGIVVAGQGDTASKTALGTTDGYVYSIPMFKVHRRNSGGYSVNNGNGACTYKSISSIASFSNDLLNRQTAQTTVSGADYSNINVGEVYWIYSNTYALKVISKDGNNNVTLMNVSPNGLSIKNTAYTWKVFSRPELSYADIVDIRDIIDLRHQVSLTGFNYQQLLEENFNKLLRGELQIISKTTMLKTYHGVAKTPIDANTVFYASFDGTTVAEVGGATGLNPNYSLMPTGLGIVKSTGNTGNQVAITLGTEGTIDFWIDFSKFSKGTNYIICLGNGVSNNKFSIWINDLNYFNCGVLDNNNNAINSLTLNLPVLDGKHKVRISFKVGYPIKMFIDGVLRLSTTQNYNNEVNVTSLILGNRFGNDRDSAFCISDLSISNVDRGAIFATLPQDFIDGYARISNAFNSQRSVFSDALTSETPLAQVKCSGSNSKEITVGDSSVFPKVDTAKWNSGDRIKVKGLGGEVISGVIDSDTALARITSVVSGLGSVALVITLNNTAGLVVNDIVNVYTNTNTVYGNTLTVCAISGNQVTLSYGSNVSSTDVFTGGYIVDVDPTHSSPIVKANLTGTAQAGASSTITLPSTFSSTDGTYNGLTITITSGTGVGQVRTISGYVGSTKVATVSSAWTTNPDATSVFLITGVPIIGTWSGLGTNESTFTLGSNNGLVAQDLFIYYSLNEVAGQGGISEVLTATLAGESNGKKLVANPSVHVRDDFSGKISGNTTVCPNIEKNMVNTTLQAPSNFVSEVADYTSLKTLDNTGITISDGRNGYVPQQLFSFNLIRILEDKFGALPCPPDTASKVAWLKANIKSIACNWWGYGSCPSGNKAYFTPYVNNNWQADVSKNTAGTSTATSYALNSSYSSGYRPSDAIDVNGCINLLAYTDASDGVTPSSIYSDYINIEITLNTSTGYDVLVPENPRRDDGKGNILLVRKETKEIQTMFPRNNIDGIVTYGDYVPYQFWSDAINRKILCYMEKLWIISNGTGSPNIDFAPTKISARLPRYNGSLKIWDDYMLTNTDLVALNGLNTSDMGGLGSYFLPPKTVIFGKIVGDSNSSPSFRTGEYVNTLSAIYAENLKSPCPHLIVSCGLSKDYDGSLLMLVRTTFTKGSDCCSAGNGLNSAVGIVRLANRPLIK